MNKKEINELRGNYKLRETIFFGMIFVVLGFIFFTYTAKIITYTQRQHTQAESDNESTKVEVHQNRSIN
jgi:hypothetical protein